MTHEQSITSKDGTTIGFEQTGNGPTVILVASALADRGDAAKLARLLAPHFTVINYDRRGRGASGDTTPYAVEREVEDIAALVAEAGGSTCLFGSSSGAVLALEAAARGVGVEKLALFEPPFVVDEADPGPPADFAGQLNDMLARGRRGEAVKYFMTKGIGMPSILVSMMRLMPRMWSKTKAMAHTIPYDVAIMGDNQTGKPLRAEQWSSVTMPTLVMDGSKSPPFLRHAAAALADVLPNARHRTLGGLSHAAVVTAPNKLVPVLREFFQG